MSLDGDVKGLVEISTDPRMKSPNPDSVEPKIETEPLSPSKGGETEAKIVPLSPKKEELLDIKDEDQPLAGSVGDSEAKDESVETPVAKLTKTCSVSLSDVRKRKFGDEVKVNWQVTPKDKEEEEEVKANSTPMLWKFKAEGEKLKGLQDFERFITPICLP